MVFFFFFLSFLLSALEDFPILKWSDENGSLLTRKVDIMTPFILDLVAVGPTHLLWIVLVEPQLSAWDDDVNRAEVEMDDR